MEKSDIGTRLSHIRREEGLSRQKLADRSGVSKGLIQQYEENRSRFSIYSFCKICRGLEVDPLLVLDPDIYDKFYNWADRLLITAGASPDEPPYIPELGNEDFHKFLTDEFLSEDILDFFKENFPPEQIADLLEETSGSYISKDFDIYQALNGKVPEELSDLITNYCSLKYEGRKLVEDLCQALAGNPNLRIR